MDHNDTAKDDDELLLQLLLNNNNNNNNNDDNNDNNNNNNNNGCDGNQNDVDDDDLECHKRRAYLAAKDGLAMTLSAMLADHSNEITGRILNEIVVEDDGQQRYTPLIVAARHGHERVVRLLTSSQYATDLEVEGTVKFDGYVIEGVNALWCAAGSGHLNVVKCLVKAGADVNHATRTNSTPLRAACFDGRLDIVRYLVEHGASVHVANKYNNTCLMIAAYKGHVDVVAYLLARGARVDERALCGATALHFAAENGHVEIARALLAHGAALLAANAVGMTPLKAAAERTCADLVEFMIALPQIGRREAVEALELLGASYANDKDNYSVERAYEYLLRTMELRYADPDDVIAKEPLDPPVAAYEMWRECRTVEEVRRMRGDANAIHMESLTVRERILGRHNPELPHPIIYRGAVFADNARFDRCIELWLHAVALKQSNRVTIVKDLLRFAQVFSQMLHVGIHVTYANVVAVVSVAIVELETCRERLLRPKGAKDDRDTLMDDMECNLTTTLYLLTILTKLLQFCNDEERFNVNRMVFVLNQLNCRAKDGQTLLHLACNAETPVDDFHTNDVCKFPCARTVNLLIKCGADVNAMDRDRNTPLHVIVNYQKPISDFVTLHSIIMDLTEAGAHIDCVNRKGETPLDSTATGVAEIILKTQIKLSLKCMAANAIKLHRLDYVGLVPRALESFVEMHGSKASMASRSRASHHPRKQQRSN